MIELLQITQGIIERGLIFGIIVAAVYLASRLINFDNLAVEGAFGLGGAITAYLILSKFMLISNSCLRLAEKQCRFRTF